MGTERWRESIERKKYLVCWSAVQSHVNNPSCKSDGITTDTVSIFWTALMPLQKKKIRLSEKRIWWKSMWLYRNRCPVLGKTTQQLACPSVFMNRFNKFNMSRFQIADWFLVKIKVRSQNNLDRGAAEAHWDNFIDTYRSCPLHNLGEFFLVSIFNWLNKGFKSSAGAQH